MKAKALEIRWHDTQSIFSADFQALAPNEYRKVVHPYTKHAASAVQPAGEAAVADEPMWRLATAGADKLIRLWLVHPRPASPLPSTSKVPQDTGPSVEYLATLKKHDGVVNAVRFAPTREGAASMSMLASAGDDGNIIFWIPSLTPTVAFGDNAEDAKYEREHWRAKSQVRNHSATDGHEIYDIAWSPDGSKIMAGAVDHSVRIYHVSTGQCLREIVEHTSFVQGVAWDPWDRYIATQSSDRSMHIYSLKVSSGTLSVHAVGKNSKMAITPSTRPSSTASSKPSKDVLNPLPPAPVLEKGKEVDRALPVASSSATPAAATKVFGRTDSALEDSESELPNSMDPPAARAASSRRSSASGSQPSRSPLLLPTHLHPRLLRSPSPAPLPAVHLPPSPKMAAAVAPSVDLAGSASPGTAPPAKPNLTALYSDPKSTPFFRRLCWSTDGSLLLTPAGLWEDPYADIAQIGKAKEGKKKAKSEDALQPKAKGKPTVYIYSRGNIERPPIAHLPGHQTTSIAIRFCPVLWELREGVSVEGEGEQEGEGLVHVHLGTEGVEVQLPGSGSAARAGEPSRPTSSLFDLPYRMVYAVATLDAVFLYDTQQAGPICMFGNLHYAPFTDLSWSPDGQTLVVSSQDGYCSIVAFDPLELGTPYVGAAKYLPPVSSLPDVLVPVASTSTSSSATASSSRPLPPLPTPAPAVAPAAEVPEVITIDSSPEKRAGEETGGEPVKKKAKKATLTFLGPIPN